MKESFLQVVERLKLLTREKDIDGRAMTFVTEVNLDPWISGHGNTSKHDCIVPFCSLHAAGIRSRSAATPDVPEWQ
jgi:hypothetical protein